ncbi:hypothetical protein K438DRAFT_1908661 [Mycena galopus ATCC 62051]|nr:hypothetical protein K438DRAFT_1908661 [Mycena galopus ATCC 62051]
MTALPGVNAVPAEATPETTALSLFSLAGRVTLVTGGHHAIGLKMELTLAEAGAVVYCLDLPTKPESEWVKVQSYYICDDVTDQEAMWTAAESIASIKGRIDIGIANAGFRIICSNSHLKRRNQLMDVNVCGVLFTAQAVGRQMERFRISGSTVLTASMNGTVANNNLDLLACNMSKSAVLQMARSLACELAPKEICVNRISPGYIPSGSQNPMGRFGKPDELRGVTLWLASDASTFCTGSE